MPPRLIDIGINLTDPMFRGLYHGKRAHVDDLAQVLLRSKRAGVDRMIVTTGNLSDCKEALDLVRDHDGLYMTVGCHPTRCSEFDGYAGGPDGYFNALKIYLDNPETKGKIVAIGECGLDYDRLHFCPKETQQKYFERQFDLAEKTRLPMFLHNRNTEGDFGKLIAKHRSRFTNGVVHSFTGSVEEMKQYLDLGLYIGINGCSLKTEESLKVAASVPLDRLMLETDGPWCDIRPTHASFKHLSKMTPEQQAIYSPPSKKKEKFELGLMVKNRNESCTMGQVLYVMADLHNMDPEALADIVYENTTKVFFPEAEMVVQPTKLAQRMKKDGSSSNVLNGNPKMKKSTSASLWNGTSDFSGYGRNSVSNQSDEQDENMDITNNESTSTLAAQRKRKSVGRAERDSKIGGAEVDKHTNDIPTKKQKSSALSNLPPVNTSLINYFNKIQVNDIKKPKLFDKTSIPVSSDISQSSESPRSVQEPQSNRSLKEMFDRIPRDLIRPKDEAVKDSIRDIAKKQDSISSDSFEMASSSGNSMPKDRSISQNDRNEDSSIITSTQVNIDNAMVNLPETELMDEDKETPAPSNPVKRHKVSSKPPSKATLSKKTITTSDNLEEKPNNISIKGSRTNNKKSTTIDLRYPDEVKYNSADNIPKDDQSIEELSKTRSVLEYFKFKPKSAIKELDTFQNNLEELEDKTGLPESTSTSSFQDKDQNLISPSEHLVPEPETCLSILSEYTSMVPVENTSRESTRVISIKEPVHGIKELSQSTEIEEPVQSQRRRLVRGSQLPRKLYYESSDSDKDWEEMTHTPRRRRETKEIKQSTKNEIRTDPSPESDKEAEAELIHVESSRRLFKAYFGSTSSLPQRSKEPKELIEESRVESKTFDLGVTRPVQKTYSKRPTSIKKVKKKHSAFSGSDEPRSDHNSHTDDDLSDFDIKPDEKPDPNQMSISSMFCKAPPRAIPSFSRIRPERIVELTPLSQSILSGGLINVGNTCYLNSVLQALRNTRGCTDTLNLMMQRIVKLACSVNRDLNSSTYRWKLFEQVVKIFHDLDKREGRKEPDQAYERSLCPKQIIEILRGGTSQFNSAGQQDAPEFLLYLISHFDDIQKSILKYSKKLVNKLNRDATDPIVPKLSPAEKSELSTLLEETEDWEPVNILFEISTERVQVCAKCDKVTVRNDRDFDLTVQIDTSNPDLIRDLEWGISDTMKQEFTTDDNKRFCEQCKTNEDAHISNFFVSLPHVMILRLQRSNYLQSAVKIPNGVACSQRMNFKQWMSSRYTGEHHDYELCAIIVHRGRDISAGHYFAYIRKDVEIETTITEPNGESKMEKKSYTWLKYNDSAVDPVSDEDMEKLFSGNSKKLASTSQEAKITEEDKIGISSLTTIMDDHVATPYVYLYRRIDS
ncbi:TatD DNase [Linnemannia zychae]|nr:TatD DNase [Linnemannia zychae]